MSFNCIYIIGISIPTANKALRFTESYGWATGTTNIFRNAKRASLLWYHPICFCLCQSQSIGV